MATRANFNKQKTDEDESLEARHGKKPNQKLKPYLVLQILMENTDENHIMSAADIVAALDEMICWALDEGYTFAALDETFPEIHFYE